ncbi:hypothetical protein POV27_10640 [Aureisphaera galaxeae]|uniref:hypothetical protein n=1 Tax=Aureisphaera galaxeae TaxID=1538023 RepID=UPI0023507D39|nr:hypothetical protein [Aureisphaera galaxeae]MDC8004505.1 hypothetical protein [Aureisphaera galaxeae]
MRNLLTFALLFVFTASSFAQNCGATLTVEKDRNSKAVYENGAFFTLELTNTSSSTKTFTLSTALMQEGCERGQKSLQSAAVADLSFVNSQSKKSLSNITLRGKETYKFYVKAMASGKSASKQWGCYEVIADQDGCTTSTVVKVYVPNPTEQ